MEQNCEMSSMAWLDMLCVFSEGFQPQPFSSVAKHFEAKTYILKYCNTDITKERQYSPGQKVRKKKVRKTHQTPSQEAL